NIFNMCMLKKLNVISITDHNTALQYKTFEKLKDSYDFLLIYGMEISVNEGFHVLAYFKELDEVMRLEKIIDDSLDKSIIAPQEQVICDEYDEVESIVPYWKNQKIKYKFTEIIDIIIELNGIVVPAHIERKGSGILSFIKDFSLYDIDAIEIDCKSNIETLEKEYPYIKKYKYLFNSDAHSIEMINEPLNYMELDDLSFKSFRKWIRSNKS
ncbi:MAG: hypothetical protein WCR33_03680, partial [Bacilli bacterium]